MLNWLTQKPRSQYGELGDLTKKCLGPQYLAVAVAKTIRAYVDDVKMGVVAYPAHRRANASTVEIWRDLRLEALHGLFNYGKSDVSLLCNQKQQLSILTCFLEERPHLEMPQPRGEPIPDTIQAMVQVYDYLAKVGDEVCDRCTEADVLRLTGRSVLDQLTNQATRLRIQWKNYKNALDADKHPFPDMPRTLIEVLIEDVTAKAKSIALSANFGPSYEVTINQIAERFVDEGHDASDFYEIMDQLMSAKDPDDFPQQN